MFKARSAYLLLATGAALAVSSPAMAQLQAGEGKQNVPGGIEHRPGSAGSPAPDAARPQGSTRSMTPPASRSAPAPAAPPPAPAPAKKDESKEQAPKS